MSTMNGVKPGGERYLEKTAALIHGFQKSFWLKKGANKTEMAFGRIPAYCRYELFMERYRSAAEIIRNHKALGEETMFLDVGCGEGFMKHFFDSNEGEWHGVEVWKERQELCKALGYKIADIDINSTPLPYPDEFFDVVLASHVIEHLSNIDFCIGELNRVLKKDGILLIATPTKPPGIAALLKFLRGLMSKKLGETQHAFSAISLKRFIEQRLKGYTLIDSRGFRLISARRRIKLENSFRFYRVSTFLGKHLTILVPEVNLIYRKGKIASALGKVLAFLAVIFHQYRPELVGLAHSLS